jgi:RNA-binding protein
LTSKERAALRAESHHLDPIFQIGKGGLSEAFYKQVDEALTTRELIKVRVLLETTPISPKEAAEELSKATGAEIIGVVGGVIILYRYSQELHDKEKQKAANIRKAERDRKSNARNREQREKNRNFRRNV